MMEVAGKRVYLACGSTDMRKSINGLMTIVEENFKLDPFEGALFVFCNRNRDRVKVLVWDMDGFWLHLKRLEKGHFKWPSLLQNEAGDQSNGNTDCATMTFTGEELSYLLNGTRVELKVKRKEVFERRIS